MKNTLILISILYLLSFQAIIAKSLVISAPYLPENVELDGKNGREIAIINAVVGCMGYTANIEVNPYLRHLKLFTQNKYFDAVSTVPVGHKLVFPISVPHVYYHNGAIVATQKSKLLRSPQDLKGKHVIAFKDAKNLLPGLKEIIPEMASYKETTEQFNHNKMLMKKRVDVVISDGLIFMAHHRRLFPKQLDKVIFKPLFKPIPFYMAFRSPVLRDKFNKCFEDLSKKGLINKINKSFINKYESSLGPGYLGI